MKNTNNNSLSLYFEEILKKTKNLKSDTVYPYQVFGATGDKLRVYISRLADRGIVVKTGRGLFYKPSKMVVVKRSMKEIPLNKKLFSKDSIFKLLLILNITIYCNKNI